MMNPFAEMPRIDPYRLFFPLGIAYAILGAGLWLLSTLDGFPYPAVLHRMLMIQGFEQCFIVGFLLTALPGLTHAKATQPVEMFAALAALFAFGLFALAGWHGLAHACHLMSLFIVLFVALVRLPRASQPPPEEFLFVGLGLAFGISGALLLTLESFGVADFGAYRLANRLLSLGMVLTLVLGVGALLVPAFIGMQGPLEIPGIAQAHQRGPRRTLYLLVAAMFITAFVLELAGRTQAGAGLRALAATIMVLWVWKLYRGPGRGDVSAWSMWSAGALACIGLWVAALGPRWMLAGMHITFIGGFGLLTLAIATRVVVSHGRHGIQAEPLVLGRLVVFLLILALAARIMGEFRIERANHWFALGGALWIGACLWWFKGALPRIRVIRGQELIPPPS